MAALRGIISSVCGGGRAAAGESNRSGGRKAVAGKGTDKTVRGPIKLNSSVKRSGAQAYARAALRWKFQATDLTAFYALSGDAGAKVMKKAASGTDGTEVPADSLENDLEYVVDVTIGTPGVTLKLDFDTGSSDLWVWSSELTGVTTSGHTLYNPAQSSTAKDLSGASWNISYGDGSSASGDVYTDTVKIGTVSIASQAVELAKKLSSSFVSSGSDGLLGLAWPSINTVSPTPQATPVENMISQGLISQSLFSVKLDRGDDSGFYTFGEIDTSVTTDTIEYAAVDNSQGFWQFQSTSWVLNGTTKTRSGNTAIADTGTTLCLVDDATVKAIYDAIPGSKMDSQQGGYVYPSSATPPSVSFAVGSKQISISAANFPYGDATDGYYFGGIQSRGTLDFDILGDVWLKNAYVVFDQGNTRIGVAQRTD